MTSLLILNGPNLNLLGTREPEIYGHTTLADIEAQCAEKANALNIGLTFRQSNLEGELVSWIQEGTTAHDAVIINAAGYTHTSVAIHDALKMLEIPVIELHISNPHAREEFRHRSLIAPVAHGVIAGFGAAGYGMAIDAAMELL
jgi:3-dehydroquinate dehydratase-2